MPRKFITKIYIIPYIQYLKDISSDRSMDTSEERDICIRDNKCKINFDIHYDAVSRKLGKALYKECKTFIEETRGEVKRRTNFVLGDKGMIYTVEFGGYGDREKITTKYTTLSWKTIPSILKAKEKLERKLDCVFTCCVIQYYPSGKYGINPHKDREIFKGNNTIIAGLSLGATRTLTLTPPKFLNVDMLAFELPRRSLYVLHSPTNDFWMHSIPKDSTTKPRISLTFRNL